jgi:hypothetical protein
MLKAGLTEQLRVQIDFLINYSQMYGAIAQYQARRALTKQLANVRTALVVQSRFADTWVGAVRIRTKNCELRST